MSNSGAFQGEVTKALALQQIPAVGGLHAAISHKFVSRKSQQVTLSLVKLPVQGGPEGTTAPGGSALTQLSTLNVGHLSRKPSI